jgi:polyhydroxyalkanoate synthesis regulator phasin
MESSHLLKDKGGIKTMKNWRKAITLFIAIAIAVVSLGSYGCSESSDATGTETLDEVMEPETTPRERDAKSTAERVGENSGMQGRGRIATLDAPVAEGIITQEQADQIMQLMEENGGVQSRNMARLLDEAIAEGIITQEEANEVREFMIEIGPPAGKE